MISRHERLGLADTTIVHKPILPTPLTTPLTSLCAPLIATMTDCTICITLSLHFSVLQYKISMSITLFIEIQLLLPAKSTWNIEIIDIRNVLIAGGADCGSMVTLHITVAILLVRRTCESSGKPLALAIPCIPAADRDMEVCSQSANNRQD
jgi:hypothetical protein